MDKLAKVRAEIERRMLEDYNHINDEQDVIAQGVCADMLHFIDSLQEEPVSEDLEEAALQHLSKYYGTNIIWDEDERCVVQDFKAGAKWQKAKDQETIELAEDHAMLAGMEKMKEQMMKDAVGGLWIRRNKYTKKNVLQGFDVTHDAFQKFNDGDKVKMIVVKEE